MRGLPRPARLVVERAEEVAEGPVGARFMAIKYARVENEPLLPSLAAREARRP
jgi:hypothetical protein